MHGAGPGPTHGDPEQVDARGSGAAEPAMSWTQPARPNTGQAQLFEAPAPERASAPAATPPPMSPPGNAAAPSAAPAAPQVVWSSAPAPDSWHSEPRRDE